MKHLMFLFFALFFSFVGISSAHVSGVIENGKTELFFGGEYDVFQGRMAVTITIKKDVGIGAVTVISPIDGKVIVQEKFVNKSTIVIPTDRWGEGVYEFHVTSLAAIEKHEIEIVR